MNNKLIILSLMILLEFSAIILFLKESKRIPRKKTLNIWCLLQISTFISIQKLKVIYALLQKNKYPSVTPVALFTYPIFRSLKFTEDNYLTMYCPDYINSRSQDLPDAYHDAGSFYWVRTEILLREKSLFTKNGTGTIINEMEVQDIDTETDWKLAELKYSILHGE